MTSPHQPGSVSKPLLIGVLAFAVVFLLIIAGTVGVLLFQHSRSGKQDPTSSAPTTSASSATTSDAATPTAEEEYCWNAASVRNSQNPSGKLQGGGLVFTPPSYFGERSNSQVLAFSTDTAVSYATVEPDWISYAMVGELAWQDGYEYPGAATAADRLLDCVRSNSSTWEGTSNRQIENRDLQGVTIDGHHGYRASGDITFDTDRLKKTTGSRLVIIVVDTPDGPSVFGSEAAIGIQDSLDAQKEAEESLAAAD